MATGQVPARAGRSLDAAGAELLAACDVEPVGLRAGLEATVAWFRSRPPAGADAAKSAG